MQRFKDLTSQKFSKLLVLCPLAMRAMRNQSRAHYLCVCDCGNLKVANSNSLKQAQTKSCGCLLMTGKPKHSLTGTPLYNVWIGIKSRCNNPKDTGYKYYGARGITVCAEWDDFTKFHSWAVTNGYRPKLELDRMRNSGNYEPGNCRFVTPRVNANNRRRLTNKTGYTGVNKVMNHFVAQCWDGTTTNHLGCFPTAELAVYARNAYILREGLPQKPQKVGGCHA